jgi:hypothetical protein
VVECLELYSPWTGIGFYTLARQITDVPGWGITLRKKLNWKEIEEIETRKEV